MLKKYKVDTAGERGARAYLETMEEATSERSEIMDREGKGPHEVRVWERKPNGGWLLLYGQRR